MRDRITEEEKAEYLRVQRYTDGCSVGQKDSGIVLVSCSLSTTHYPNRADFLEVIKNCKRIYKVQ